MSQRGPHVGPTCQVSTSPYLFPLSLSFIVSLSSGGGAAVAAGKGDGVDGGGGDVEEVGDENGGGVERWGGAE